MLNLRYDEAHWSREKDSEKALKQYLDLSKTVFNRTMMKVFEKLTGDVTGKTILDYGGGIGIMAVLYAKNGANVFLVDAEFNALSTAMFYAKREGVEDNIHTIHSETFPVNLKQGKFDMVIAKDVLEHIVDDQKFLHDLSDCQDEGGILLLSTQNSNSLNYLLERNYQNYWCRNSDWCGWDPTHIRFYTASSLKDKLNRAGYRTEKWASIYIIPYNIISWCFFLKLNIYSPSLHYFDLLFGRLFPFNRIGWNFIVRAKKVCK